MIVIPEARKLPGTIHVARTRVETLRITPTRLPLGWMLRKQMAVIGRFCCCFSMYKACTQGLYNNGYRRRVQLRRAFLGFPRRLEGAFSGDFESLLDRLAPVLVVVIRGWVGQDLEARRECYTRTGLCCLAIPCTVAPFLQVFLLLGLWFPYGLLSPGSYGSYHGRDVFHLR